MSRPKHQLQVYCDRFKWSYSTTKKAAARGWDLDDPLTLWQQIHAAPGKNPPLDALRRIINELQPAEPASKIKSIGKRILDFQDFPDDQFRSGIELELERLTRECHLSTAEWAREIQGGDKTTRRKIDQLNSDLFRTLASLEPSIRETERSHLTSVDAHGAINKVVQKFAAATKRLTPMVVQVFDDKRQAAPKITAEIAAISARFADTVQRQSFQPTPLSHYWRMTLSIRRRANQFYREYAEEGDLSLRATRHKIWVDEMQRFAKFVKDAQSTEFTAGSLVAKSTVDQLMSRASAEWRSDLEQLPQRLAFDAISAGHDQVKVKEEVRREVDDVLYELAGVSPAERKLLREHPNQLSTPESLDEIAWPNYTKTFLRLKAAGRTKVNDDEIQQLIAAQGKDREYRKRKWGF